MKYHIDEIVDQNRKYELECNLSGFLQNQILIATADKKLMCMVSSEI